jgi:hypothetical protein
LEIKLRGCHFDKIEVIEAELKEVINFLIDHNFHDAFKT